MTICVPFVPIRSKIQREEKRTIPTIVAHKANTNTIKKDINTEGLFSAYKITVVIEPGPINNGIATGTKIWLNELRA